MNLLILDSLLSIHHLLELPYSMASLATAIDINDGDFDLTTLNSGDTPTNPWSNDTPQIQAFQRALGNKIQYQQVLDSIPQDHQIKVKSIRFITYKPYRTPREVKDAWYWGPEQASELFRVTKGISCLSNMQY